MLRQALATLGPDQAELIRLSHLKGLKAEKIATNVLADRLRALEADGVIRKFRDSDNRRRNIYRLTEKGLAIAPIILEMMHWGAKYDSNTNVPDKLLKNIKKDREDFLKNLRARVELA